MIELAGISALLLIALLVEHRNHRHEVDQILAETSHERQKLLDRIQHPEVRQIEPIPQDPPEPPADAAELAFVGQEVPEFINVGGSD